MLTKHTTAAAASHSDTFWADVTREAAINDAFDAMLTRWEETDQIKKPARPLA